MNQCDEQTGCPLPQDALSNAPSEQSPQSSENTQHTKVIFVTDTICSHCWAIEPQWRKLQLQYRFDVQYIHGGLLPGWEGFADSGNAIAKPADVIPHWQHVAEVSGQPIDPSVWANDPLPNSYVLCQSAIAVRLIDPALESAFVRKMRERVFMNAVNICQTEVLVDCANALGIDGQTFLTRLQSDEVVHIFQTEQMQMHRLGARGFPSIIFSGANPGVLVGARPYEQLQRALTSQGLVIEQMLSVEQKLARFNSWTLAELCQVFELSPSQAKEFAQTQGFVETQMSAGQLFIK